jgi:N-methylhydantoinase A
MERQAIEEFTSVGIDEQKLSFQWEADIRFEGQFFEFSLPVPRRNLDLSTIQTVRRAFVAMYEERYGSETAWKEKIEIVNCRLRTRESRPPLRTMRWAEAPSSAARCVKGNRRAYISPAGMINVPIYDGGQCSPGTVLEGPAIVEEEMTTILIPVDFKAKRDSLMNYVLTTNGGWA